MALNDRNSRASAIGLSRPYAPTLPLPGTTDDSFRRLQAILLLVGSWTDEIQYRIILMTLADSSAFTTANEDAEIFLMTVSESNPFLITQENDLPYTIDLSRE